MASVLMSRVSPGFPKFSLSHRHPHRSHSLNNLSIFNPSIPSKSSVKPRPSLNPARVNPFKQVMKKHQFSNAGFCKQFRFHPSFRFVACISTSSSGVGDEEGSKENKNQSGNSMSQVGCPKANVSWIDSCLPGQLQPYARLARLDKQIGTWLLVWPSLWSITLAAAPAQLPEFKTLALFGCWALSLRGAACTINDILDRDIDAKVERTKFRPLASGLVTPFQGLCFLGFQVLLVLGILRQMNNYSQVLGATQLLLVFTYPLMKRITYWPQAYLGLAWNWGALLGWAAIKGSLDPAIVLPLYVSGVFWTLVYDTIYAHQDKEDDLKVGVKSTALLFGDSTKQWLTAFGTACIGGLALTGFNAQLGWPYYAFLAAASGHLAWQIWTVDLSSATDCSRKFVSNKWFGAVLFGGILAAGLSS